MLYAMEIPSEGGNTLFSNQYKVYESLPEATRQRIEGLKAVNSFEPGRYDNYALTLARGATPSAALSWAHPMVRTHPATGKKALYVNRLMTESIVGMTRDDSRALLESLFEHQEQPQFIYEHRWTRGDVVIWDNRCVPHARTNFDALALRKLRRVTVSTDKGEHLARLRRARDPHGDEHRALLPAGTAGRALGLQGPDLSLDRGGMADAMR